MSAEATLARFREYMVGPARFMNLLSCFELGVVDALRDKPGLTAADLGAALGAKPDAIEQLLFLPVKEGFIGHDPATGGYRLDALAELTELDLRRVLEFMDKIKVTTLRQLFWLTESVQTGTVVGLRELYGFDGDLYAAMGVHAELRESWSRLMDTVTERIDPWFFQNIAVPSGSRVLDLAGNTGLGAVHTLTLTGATGLHVTTFDLPEKEAECLKNFREAGVAEQTAFVGGDVFVSVPTGFDVVLVKHFLNMFDKSEAVKILQAVHAALKPGGQVHILVPVYTEDLTQSRTVDYYPAFFLGAAIAQGGPQKVSTFSAWLAETGFTDIRAVTQDLAELPPDALPLHGILTATKPA